MSSPASTIAVGYAIRMLTAASDSPVVIATSTRIIVTSFMASPGRARCAAESLPDSKHPGRFLRIAPPSVADSSDGFFRLPVGDEPTMAVPGCTRLHWERRMFWIITKPPISRRRKRMALMVAGFVDFLQIAVFPFFFEGGLSPFDDVVDVFAAIALTMICGFKWQFVLAFFMELVPFFDILPTWTAVALLLPASDGIEESARVNVSVVPPAPPALAEALPELIEAQAQHLGEK